MILSNEDKEFIEFAWGCINRARYCDSRKLTTVYNRCFADRVNFTPVKDTSCGSCLRQRVIELKRELDKVMKLMEKNNETKEPETPDNSIKSQENENAEDVKEVESTAQPQKKKGRQKSKQTE